ncbi:VOC family protein [Thalassotalea sp. HSM 43]|uniref:VOC family protein n=1 Tax=Thalassotalea sp. HSM 43 TaxID=2552945 RepID=UPI001080B8DB|nr:VOC family protein [Thalassotalea sp. HSM 43]QBY05363.1 VOC family protein [Thalassotalea sp. HSM 43]
MNLNQVTLPVNDMVRATDFYRTLGFTQIVDTPHYARFQCPDGDATFSLSLEESPEQSSEQSSELSSEQPLQQASAGCGAVIYFEHEQLDQWVAQLQQRDIVFAQLPTDQRYLWREAILYDPSGNKIKLYWAGENRLNPPWRVDIRE